MFVKTKKEMKRTGCLLCQKQSKCFDSFPFTDCFLYLVISVFFIIIAPLFWTLKEWFFSAECSTFGNNFYAYEIKNG